MASGSASRSTAEPPKREAIDHASLLSSDNEPSSDELVERELQDQLAEQKKLDARFTPKQLDHLTENKDHYRYAPANQRREIAQATGDLFLKQIQKAGRDPSKAETAALYDVSLFQYHLNRIVK